MAMDVLVPSRDVAIGGNYFFFFCFAISEDSCQVELGIENSNSFLEGISSLITTIAYCAREGGEASQSAGYNMTGKACDEWTQGYNDGWNATCLSSQPACTGPNANGSFIINDNCTSEGCN